MPGIADNALVKAAALIERLGEFAPEPRLEPETEALLDAVTGACRRPRRGRSTLARAVDPVAAEFVEPLLGMTVSPTMIDASHEAERHPGALRGDRRLPAAARADAGGGRGESCASWLGEGDYELEWHRRPRRHALADGTPLWVGDRAIRGRDSSRARGRADLPRGVHGQPLAAGGVRNGRVRVLPDADDGPAARGAARPLGGRADRGSTTSSSASSSCATRPGR